MGPRTYLAVDKMSKVNIARSGDILRGISQPSSGEASRSPETIYVYDLLRSRIPAHPSVHAGVSLLPHGSKI